MELNDIVDEIDKIEASESELNALLDKQTTEMNIFEKDCAAKLKRKMALQSKLQTKLDQASSSPSTIHGASALLPECPVCLEEMKPHLKIFNHYQISEIYDQLWQNKLFHQLNQTTKSL